MSNLGTLIKKWREIMSYLWMDVLAISLVIALIGMTSLLYWEFPEEDDNG